MFDDLCFYLQRHGGLLDGSDPDSAAVFAKKIVSAHYLGLSRWFHSLISHTQYLMSRHERLDPFNIGLVESQWSDVQALERRSGEYCRELESLMVECRIPVEASGISSPRCWDDSTADFQFLYLRFKDIRHRMEILNASITGLAGMSGNRQALRDQEVSLKEAKRMKALTFMGLVFFPLAYTASLFSMAEPYGPGSAYFWLYFAVSIPLILLVTGIYFLLDMRHRQ